MVAPLTTLKPLFAATTRKAISYPFDLETERDDGTFGYDGNLNGLWLGITWRQ